MLAERILKHADNLSKTIQATTMSAVEAHHSVSVLEKMRTDESFDQFWALVCSSQQSLDINDPVLPRARKRPRRYDEGAAEQYIPSDVKQHYQQIYYQSLDKAIMAIEDRFHQGDYQTYARLEQLLLAAEKKDEFQEIVKFYESDFNAAELKTQLEVFSEMHIELSGLYHDLL